MERAPADHATAEAEAPATAEAEAPPPADPVGPRIYGVVDVLRPDRIAGWAIDRRDSAAALDVDILRQGAIVRTVRADRRRADLERGGVGTGNYGFRAEIEPPLEPGFEFTVAAVARAPDGASAPLGRVGPALQAPDPTTRLLQRIYEELTRRVDAAVVTGALAAPRPDAAIADALTRIDVAQARIEAALASIAAPQPQAPDPTLRRIVFGTLAVAVASLGVGLGSLWWP